MQCECVTAFTFSRSNLCLPACLLDWLCFAGLGLMASPSVLPPTTAHLWPVSSTTPVTQTGTSPTDHHHPVLVLVQSCPAVEEEACPTGQSASPRPLETHRATTWRNKRNTILNKMVREFTFTVLYLSQSLFLIPYIGGECPRSHQTFREGYE